MTVPELTVDIIAGLVGGGVSWWRRGGVYVANDADWRHPVVEGDVYVLDASPAWLAQFEGDWQACADQVNPLLARHES